MDSRGDAERRGIARGGPSPSVRALLPFRPPTADSPSAMPRAICRCGHALPVPADPSERVVCPGCGARVRIRHKAAAAAAAGMEGDGYIRFFCPCGRRLKVDAAAPPPNGKCPDCGRIVPVPTATQAHVLPPGHPEALTDELPAVDREALQRWSEGHRARARAAAPPTAPHPAPEPEPAPPTEFGITPTLAFSLPASDRVEVGLRICAECGQPVPMGATACRNCGAPVAKR